MKDSVLIEGHDMVHSVTYFRNEQPEHGFY